MMPKFHNFKENLICENLIFNVYVAVDNVFEICRKLNDEETIKTGKSKRK